MFLLEIIFLIKSFTKIINNYKRKRILDTTFNYIEICIKYENNENIVTKDFFQVSLYIS